LSGTVEQRRERRRPSRHDSGFTLIEIVVALAVLGGVMFILLETHFRALRLYDSAREQVTIRNFLSEAVGRAETEVLAGNPAGDGDFGERFPDYTYTFDAQQLGEGNILLYEVLVTVKDPEGEKHEIVFMLYDPRTGSTSTGTNRNTNTNINTNTNTNRGASPSGTSGINLSDISSRASQAASSRKR